jgi:hypothetical protein
VTVHRPGKTIDELWAFVALDDDGDEGVCAVLMGGTWIQLIAADEHRRDQFVEHARRLAKVSGQTIEVRHLLVSHTELVIEP